MKFVVYSVSENRKNGLGDEGAVMGTMPPLPPSPRIFGLELSLLEGPVFSVT